VESSAERGEGVLVVFEPFIWVEWMLAETMSPSS
jgi:hypothetical protein